ncbi:MAG: C2 family cysteine protease [Protaetiibacter sp.]
MTTTTPAKRRAASRSRAGHTTAEAARPALEAQQDEAETLATTGAPNPYALASLVAGRRIDWDGATDARSVLEDVFDLPYTEIIGSAESPLFYGSTFRGGRATRKRPAAPPTRGADDTDDREDTTPDVSRARTLADILAALGQKSPADVPVRGATLTRDGVFAEIGRTGDTASRYAKLFDLRVLDVLFPREPGYHPPGFSWQDTGRFYNETTEFFDPVQGQVADCYFIAAMSSVAWAKPFTIADRTRATAAAQDSFTHQVSFFGGSGGYGSGGWGAVEVSDRVLVASGGSTSYYAHSSEGGEIWPAVYEKAFAKWRFGTGDDFPSIPDLAWGDTVAACVSLTGGSGYYRGHSGMTDAQLLTLVKAHSSGGRTTTPMVCWSYGAGSPEAIRAANEAGVVASHAYSVLGWMRRYEWVPRLRLEVEIPRVIPEWHLPGPDPVLVRDLVAGATLDELTRVRVDLPSEVFQRYELRPVDYVIVRNPWGSTPGTGPSTTTGDFRARDVSWWRDVPLGANGVFAMEVGAFRRYFAGTGGAD